MENRPLISVIVPVYKVEEYLGRCVDSLLSQTYDNLQIILVDDGSPDNCGRICDSYAEKDSRIQVIHKSNGGLSSARNAGLEIATGEYIAFLDSDDWIEPEAYETMLALAQKYGVKLVCAGRYDVYGDNRKVGLCPKKEEVISGEELAARIFLWDNIDSSAWDKLYHKSLFRQIRYPLGKICEDVPVTYKIALDAGQVAMCPKPFVNYYHRPGSITTTAVSEKNFHFSEHTASIYPYIRQHHPAIADQARYQRVKSLSHMMLLLDTAPEEIRKKYAVSYGELKKQLAEHGSFILHCPWLGSKEKITDFLLIGGLYRMLRPIFHKGSK
ncbi:MAG: glycosyltransferase family 2 protein [Oscillospiraceae bacterium]|nr:glycosyltransferase family 2 protein [Oscillospiraceae bacterium]